MVGVKLPDNFILHYAPQTWTFARKFLVFAGPPFRVDSDLITGTAAAVAHREKYEVLGGIANDLVPEVQAEAAQLNESGYSLGRQGRALAAVSEAMLAELYSTLDGLRRAVYSAFRGTRSLQRKSTLKLFQLAAEGKYGSQFPRELNECLSLAYHSWFPRLRAIRTETTHGEIGRCWANLKTGRIQYSHGYSGRGDPELHLDDVIGYANESHDNVMRVVEFFFETFFKRLQPIERPYICGIFRGVPYQRMVAPVPDVSFNDGRCLSRSWFEHKPQYLCPLRDNCGAYTRPVSQAESDAFYKRGSTA